MPCAVLYDVLGFGQATRDDDVFLQLAQAWISESACKQGSHRVAQSLLAGRHALRNRRTLTCGAEPLTDPGDSTRLIGYGTIVTPGSGSKVRPTMCFEGRWSWKQ